MGGPLGQHPGDIGRFLQSGRESRGMTREELSRITRISLKTIADLENETWHELPAPAIVRGFVDCACRALDLDVREGRELLSEATRGRPVAAVAGAANRAPIGGLVLGARRLGTTNWTYLAILMVFAVGILVALLTVRGGPDPMDPPRATGIPMIPDAGIGTESPQAQ